MFMLENPCNNCKNLNICKYRYAVKNKIANIKQTLNQKYIKDDEIGIDKIIEFVIRCKYYTSNSHMYNSLNNADQITYKYGYETTTNSSIGVPGNSAPDAINTSYNSTGTTNYCDSKNIEHEYIKKAYEILTNYLYDDNSKNNNLEDALRYLGPYISD